MATKERRFSATAAVATVVAGGLVAATVIAMAVIYTVRKDATAAAIQDASDVTIADGEGAVAPVLTAGLFTGDPNAIAVLDRVVRDRVLGGDWVVRVKVWSPSGEILYSDEPALIGRTFVLGDEEQKALVEGKAHAEISDLTRPENVYERSYHKLLEVYDGVRTQSGQPVLFEAYLRYSPIASAGHRAFLAVLPALVAGLAILFLIEVPMALSLTRRVQRGRAEEQRLLRRALEASEVERRHLAADLHDGVVQSLVGTSMSLGAAAESATRAGLPDVAASINAAGREVRQGVRDLRSLIVSIAPPRLHEEGIAAALADLVSPLDGRGVATTLQVDDRLTLNPTVETLVYRTVQEALRNVARHSGATSVNVTVGVCDRGVHVEVVDNGVGFDPGRVPSDGHVGLHLLSDLAGEAGGTVAIDSAPGRGTRLALEVPVS